MNIESKLPPLTRDVIARRQAELDAIMRDELTMEESLHVLRRLIEEERERQGISPDGDHSGSVYRNEF